jgi:hypothetical protein
MGKLTDKDHVQNNFPKFFSAEKVSADNIISLLLGKMPNSDILTEFAEHSVDPNGNCGFTTLGVDRPQLAKTLLSLENDLSARASLTKVIENALKSQEIKPPDANGQELIETVYSKQERFDELFRKIRNVLTDEATKKLTCDQLITWLWNNNRVNEAQELSVQRLAVHQAETNLEIYCQTQEVFKYYIQLFAESGLWLDYKSALLYAKQTNIALYIWKKKENNPSQLTLIDYHEITGSSHTIQNEIHMLFTSGFSHFNLLSKSSIEERAKDSKTSPGKSLRSYFGHVPKLNRKGIRGISQDKKLKSIRLVHKNDDEFSSDDEKSDVDQAQKLQSFKDEFNKRLETAARVRKSHQYIPKQLRRLDSLARLLEANTICAAVYYYELTNCLWLANNKVFRGSRESNNYIKNINSIFDLIRNEHMSIEEIFRKLTEVIYWNISQENRHDLKKIPFDLKEAISEWIKEMFKFNGDTKEWREQAKKDLTYEEKINNVLIKIIKKISRHTRDFLKIRDFLLANTHDNLSKGIVSAIRGNKFKIIPEENKDVHAEMRILSQLLNSEEIASPYIGISKLCCDHCALAMQTFDVKCRGVHGQRANWPLPDFLDLHADCLTKYVGEKAYRYYQSLQMDTQNEAKIFIASKESNSIRENAKDGRGMYADSSDSDIEFGFAWNDKEIERIPLDSVWYVRDLKMWYQKEFYRLMSIGLSLREIVDLYKESPKKFKNLITTDRIYEFLERIAENDFHNDTVKAFKKIYQIYDDNEFLFHSIIKKRDCVIVNGLEEYCDEFIKVTSEYDSDDVEDPSDIVDSSFRENCSYAHEFNSKDNENSGSSENERDTPFNSSESFTLDSDLDSDVDTGNFHHQGFSFR